MYLFLINCLSYLLPNYLFIDVNYNTIELNKYNIILLHFVMMWPAPYDTYYMCTGRLKGHFFVIFR